MNNSLYPCIWSNNNAKEMADFHVSVFPKAKIIDVTPVTVFIEIGEQKFMLLNGGDKYSPNPSISFMYLSSSPTETELLYNRLHEEGMAMMPLDKYPFSEKYGWVEDKYSVSWQLYTGKQEDITQQIVPTLMFVGENNGKAEEAVNFYTSVFPNSSIKGLLRYGDSGLDVETHIQHGEFLLNDYLFGVMDSSIDHKFEFTPGVSIVVNCDYQEEIDAFWSILSSNGGYEDKCGWVQDQFGVSWQIVPSVLGELIKKSPKVFEELMNMGKIDIQKLTDAANL